MTEPAIKAATIDWRENAVAWQKRCEAFHRRAQGAEAERDYAIQRARVAEAKVRGWESILLQHGVFFQKYIVPVEDGNKTDINYPSPQQLVGLLDKVLDYERRLGIRQKEEA